MKPALLFLCHRIPFPPNKGDKIRSWHLLYFLSRYYDVYLGTFVDDKDDWQYTKRLEDVCASCCFVRLRPELARLHSLSGFVTGQPLSLPYYRSRELSQWVKRTVKDARISRVLVYSSAVAQFALAADLDFERRVVDFVDVDSDKWRQYAARKRWPINWLYRREADHLFEYEKRVAESFDASLFVSSAEAALFNRLAPEFAAKVAYFHNGVDTDYFQSSEAFPSPYPEGTKALVFTGAMDYWPNVDAVAWFASEVFPRVRAVEPAVRFYIVGSKPADAVRALGNQPGITVTGRVDDVRPYLHHAVAAVAPMRIARGIQNKVLEAMAMEKPVVVSPQGLEGIEAVPGREVMLADGGEAFVRNTLRVLAGQFPLMGEAARARVSADFDWEKNLPVVHRLLESAGTDAFRGGE